MKIARSIKHPYAKYETPSLDKPNKVNTSVSCKRSLMKFGMLNFKTKAVG